MNWLGTNDIVEQQDSPRVSVDENGSYVERVFEGRYSRVAASVPVRGSTMSGWGSRLRVDETRLIKLAGGRGRLEVRLRDDRSEEEDGVIGGEGNDFTPTIEVEWVEVTKSLKEHPRWRKGGGAETALTNEDLAALEIWENESYAKKAAFKYTDGDDVKELSANAKDIAEKLLAGTDSYVIYAPVVRKTTRTSSRPVTGECGKRAQAPDSAPHGYEWLKTADRRVKSGSSKWDRVEEWTGMDKWDAEIYP